MKQLIITYILSIMAFSAQATEQMPDILFYNGKELSLHTGWGHPSPLQTYYSQNNIKYPFQMWHTANYRGHIAVWKIENDKFYITEVQIEERKGKAGNFRTEMKKYKPAHFNIKSQSDSLSKDNKVFADWFSGVLSCFGKKDSYYFYVKRGNVVDVQIITEKDYKKIQKISEKDTSNIELMNKYKMLFLNRNYIAYYYRLNEKDSITFNSKGGYLSRRAEGSPLLAYYSNDHTKWPYNWENHEKTGAPNCKWIIEDSKIYLTTIQLYSGTGFYEIDKDNIKLEDIFAKEVVNKKVLGEWISGIYTVEHGKEVESEFGYKRFEPFEYTFLRIKNGIVIEKYTVSKDFDFKKIPDDASPGLKKIIEELNE